MSMFKCEHLTKKLGEYTLNDISFEIEPGMVLGVIGINGSGKTTLLRSLLGSYRLDIEPEDGGEIFLDGKHFRKDIKEYKGNIAYVLQDCPFGMNMHTIEVGERYGCYYEGFDLNKYKELLEKYEISKKKSLSELSKGQLLRVQLAFAESYPAKLYIMDEPAGNLDVDFRDSFYDTLRRIVEDENSSVIISSHLVTELEHVADQILWIGRNETSGYLRYFGGIDEMKDFYRLISLDKNTAVNIPNEMVVGSRIRESHSEYLLYKKDGKFEDSIPAEYMGELRFPDIQEIMYFIEKENA